MKTYKLHNGLPAQTKSQWIIYANGLCFELKKLELLGENKGVLYNDSLSFYNLIIKTFKVKTI